MAEVDRELAARLERAVAASGKSRTEIAKETGIDKSSLTKILSGERGVSAVKLAAIVKALGLPPADFMSGGTPDQRIPEAAPEGLAAFLSVWGDRLAPAVVRHLKASHFSVDAGVVLDEAFWLEQAGIWSKRLGLPGVGGGGEDRGQPAKKGPTARP